MIVPPSHLSRPLVPRRSPACPPLHLTVRFSSAVSDIDLDIPSPWAVRVAALKRQVRAQLPPAEQSRSLRLIYQGRMLADAALLGSVVKPVSPPPRAASTSRTSTPEPAENKYHRSDSTAPIRNGKGKDPEARQRIYILASLGPPLDTAGLATEDRLANTPPTPTHQDPDDLDNGAQDGLDNPAGTNSTRHPFSAAGLRSRVASPLPHVPRGFERLLDAGLSPSEVNQLRLQFASIQAARHTPDTMPSPDSLQRMEDTWIDSNATGSVAEAAATGAGGETEAREDSNAEDSMDALLRGLVLGFFWPLGCFSWALREEGMWSKRRHYSVWVGVVLGVSIGTLRYLGSDGG
ncbi:hypothetical protein BROUX41_001027 [Berkeleyomyces rouxiae]|uniref:uncharacterized protein n=1 Tax=Berkeleyomyces rouxiae TaxID=2035830 RepID=UPI003B767918